jgi:hypothetical protein
LAPDGGGCGVGLKEGARVTPISGFFVADGGGSGGGGAGWTLDAAGGARLRVG